MSAVQTAEYLASEVESDCCAGRVEGEEKGCCGHHGGRGDRCCSGADAAPWRKRQAERGTLRRRHTPISVLDGSGG